MVPWWFAHFHISLHRPGSTTVWPKSWGKTLWFSLVHSKIDRWHEVISYPPPYHVGGCCKTVYYFLLSSWEDMGHLGIAVSIKLQSCNLELTPQKQSNTLCILSVIWSLPPVWFCSVGLQTQGTDTILIVLSLLVINYLNPFGLTGSCQCAAL